MALGISAGLATDPRKQGAAWANGYSIETDGSTQYVKLATTTDINFLHNGGTLAYWVKFDSASSLHGIGVSTSGKQFYMGIYTLNYTYSGYQAGASYGSIGGGGLSTGTWYHLALVGTSGGNLKTYVNAVEKSSNSYTPGSSKNPVVDFFLGGTNSSASGITLSHNIDGHVDEVGIWTVPLDGDALTAIYNSGTPIDLTEDDGDYDNSSSLWGYWRCGDNDSGTGTTITDQGSASNNGTLVNGVSFTSDVP